MRKTLTIFLLFLCLNLSLSAQQLLTNIPSRTTLSLNGKWNYIVDMYENGYYDYRYQPFDANPNPSGGFFLDKKPLDKTDLVEYSFDKSPTLYVPGDWNSQDDKLFYYEGTIWYRKTFDYQKANDKNRVYLHFSAVNYEADVYLNGKKLGKHIGGFTPFDYEISSLMKPTGNSLVVKVDNKRKPEAVPTINTDWFNYGGITRDVYLVEVPETHIADYSIQLKKGTTNTIKGYVQLRGAHQAEKVTIDIPELKVSAEVKTDEKGMAQFELKYKKIDLWSPEKPKLYEVIVCGANDKFTDQVGFRTIETKGTDILLNGNPVFLRGICIHEENPIRGGRAFTKEDAKMLLTWAKELNCNYVRLAHYPHNEYMARLADEMGIMVWEEIPVYWTIQWGNEQTYNNAETQLSDLIQRDKNRAAVIIWSMANETPVSEVRTNFLKRLAAHARYMDSTRLISAAMEVHTEADQPLTKIVQDPFADFVDIINFNEYIGWYDGMPEKCDKITWQIKYKKPVMISEFGAGALEGLYGDKDTRFTEEHQEDMYIHNLSMLSKIPQFRGVSPWVLADFRSPRRQLPGIQDGWNRKGVIGQNGSKKKAFFILKNFYNQQQEKYKTK